MTHYIPVHGTWGFPPKVGDWWRPESHLRCWLEHSHGLAPLRPTDPFLWDGDLFLVPLKGRQHTGWRAAAAALRWYLRDESYVPIAERRVVSHSHGLQPILYACAEGLKIDRLLSITGPIRGDMADVARAARPNIRRWVHVHADEDWTQVGGALLDGVWGIHRVAEWAHPDGTITRADENVKIPGVGHSGLLRDAEHFHWWIDAGLIPFLTEA